MLLTVPRYFPQLKGVKPPAPTRKIAGDEEEDAADADDGDAEDDEEGRDEGGAAAEVSPEDLIGRKNIRFDLLF